MNLHQQQEDDMSIFYDTNAIAVECTFDSIVYPILFLKNPMTEIFADDIVHITGLSKDFTNINEGDQLTINNINYIVKNHDYLNEDKLEILISLGVL